MNYSQENNKLSIDPFILMGEIHGRIQCLWFQSEKEGFYSWVSKTCKLALDEPLKCEWKTYCLWPAHLKPFPSCAHIFQNHSSAIEFPANIQTLLPHWTARLMLYSFYLIYLYGTYFSKCSDVNLIQIQYSRQI